MKKHRYKKAKLKEKFKNNKNGITLIALVVTIIVLLILAGVTITMLIGADGIIMQTQKAKERTEEAVKEEEEFFASIKDKLTSNDDENIDSPPVTDNNDNNENNDKEEGTSGGIKLDKKRIGFYNIEKTPQTITATLTNLSGTINWTSSNTNVATVTPSEDYPNSAFVTMLSEGEAVITAQCGSYEATCKVIYSTIKWPKGTYVFGGKLPSGVKKLCKRISIDDDFILTGFITTYKVTPTTIAKKYFLPSEKREGTNFYEKRLEFNFDNYDQLQEYTIGTYYLKTSGLKWINAILDGRSDADEELVYIAERSLAAYNEYLKSKNK